MLSIVKASTPAKKIHDQARFRDQGCRANAAATAYVEADYLLLS
jgi:hypothetical protein